MLVAVALTASATKHTVKYVFKPGGNDYSVFTSDWDNHLSYTSYTHLSTLKGYAGATDETSKTVTVVEGFQNRLAFYKNGNDTPWNRYYCNNDQPYVYNNSDNVNLFSILNLRAGDIVKITCRDTRVNEYCVNRFITDHSDNAIDNRPWPSSTFVRTDLTTAKHQFIMKEDGDLDLNCAPHMVLESVEIISPFVEYNQGVSNPAVAPGTTSITTPTFQLSYDDRGDDNSPEDRIWWEEWSKPVVLYRGDIVGSDDPNAVSYSLNNGQGQVTVSGFSGSGAVIIMIERYMFAYTIPYQVSDGNKKWNFFGKGSMKVGRHSEDGSEGPDKLSLQAHDNAYGITHYGPLYTTSSGTEKDIMTLYQDKMYGQNSYINEETAGLVFWTSNNTYDGTSYGYLNETDKEDGDGVRYLTIRKGGGFTIPGLKKGDQVYLYMGHANNESHNGVTKAGVKFHVWNALDALKNKIGDDPQGSGDIVFCGGSMWGPNINNGSGGWAKDRNMYGALHFYAANDGDMSFQIEGDGNYDYVKLYYIHIYKNTQDIITQTDELLGNQGYEFLARQNPDGTWEDSDTRTYNLRTVNHVSTNQRFEVLECSGNLTLDDINTWGTAKSNNATTNPNYFEVKVNNTKPVYGAFMLRGKDYDHNNKYCINYADRVIAVGTLQQMNYPYTWNFKDILDRGDSGDLFSNETTAYEDSTRIWKTNGSNYEINNSAFGNGNRNWSSGAQLYASGEFIEEAAGVGFATWNQGGGNGGGSRNGDITITAAGVKIMPKNGYGMTRVFVPNLKSGQKLFIQGKRYVNGVSGFGASYLTGKTHTAAGIPTGPRVNNPWNTRYRDDSGYDRDGGSWLPLLNSKIKPMTILLGESEDEVAYDNFLYNFSSLEIEPGDVSENMVIDENLSILATTEKTVTFSQSSPSTVDNGAGLFEYGSESTNQYGRVVYDKEGNIVLQYDENGNVVLSENAVADADGNLIYDNNVELTADDNTYTYEVKLNGQGNGSYRVANLTLDANKTYDITVVLKSQNSNENRVLMVYGGAWGGDTPMATMLARDKVMSKTITDVTGQSSVYIGSKKDGIEIYAIYVKESNQSTSVKEMPFIAYIDMDDEDMEFYGQDATNVTLYLSDVLIEHMAVSEDEKQLNAIGWASESRSRYIDHRLNEVFNNKPVKAYVATGTNLDDAGKLIASVTISELTAPMHLSTADNAANTTSGTGCILYNYIPDDDILDSETGKPNPKLREAKISLFVPAIHDYIKDAKINQNSIGNTYVNTYSTNATLEANRAANVDNGKLGEVQGNMMVAKLTAGSLPATGPNDQFTYYVLSYKWNDPQGVSHPTAEEEAQNGLVEKFVRSAGASLKDNSAYIRLSTSAVNPNFKPQTGNALSIVFDGEEGVVDGIADLTISTGAEQGEGDSYYTLSGQKINKPTVPGIYVKNGKKVFVK